MQTTEIQAIYAIPLQNTKYTSHSYRALPPQPEVKLFLLLFGGLCLLCESKSGSGPQSYSRYVQHPEANALAQCKDLAYLCESFTSLQVQLI